MFTVRDASGRLVGYLEDDRLQDVNGKTIGDRVTPEKRALLMCDQAAMRMSGSQVLMDLGPGDVVAPTTQFTVGIPRPDYVADKVSAVRFVRKDRGTFFAENASDAIAMVDAHGGSAGAEPSEVQPGFVSTSFTTVGYALAARMPRQLLDNADFDLRGKTIRRLVNALRLAREVRIANLLTTAANWATANKVTVAAGAKWNTGASANPLADMMSALADSYIPSNVMILPENVAQYFYVQPQASTGIRDYVQGGGEMPDILYARGKRLNGDSPAYVWAPTLTGPSSNVAIVRISDDPDEIVTSQTARWLGAAKDGERVEGILVREYFMSQTDSFVLVVAHNDAEFFMSNQVGALIVGATQ